MERIEYRTLDKSTWARGTWDHEPDKIQFADEATGFPCLIVRNRMGFLCGYVGVSPDHPWHGTEYDDVGRYQPKPEGYDEDWYVEVHGGLTFSGSCGHGDPANSICHIPAPGEPDDVWWLGFDCGHAGDLTEIARPYGGGEFGYRDTYRDVPYVEAECRKLAQQAAQGMETRRAETENTDSVATP